MYHISVLNLSEVSESILMNREIISTLDSQNMLGSIEVFEKQCLEAWESTKNTELPDSYKSVKNIVFVGMGGSALGIDVIQKAFADQLQIPITVVNDYQLPASVNEDSLVIFSSYSGTTEEVLHAFDELRGRTKNVFIITTGGDLEKIAAEQSIPAYIFHPTYNPSNQPRMASGYSIAGTLGLFVSLGLLKITNAEMNDVAAFITSLHGLFGADVANEENVAKQTAKKLVGSFPLFISSEFLEGAVHVATNQMNENSKTAAFRLPVPEMNHHFIEAFVFPKELLSKVHVLFFESALYHDRIQKRYAVTSALAQDKGLQVSHIQMHGSTRLMQVFEAIVFGSYLSFYLAMELGIDPSPIPNVDHLKDALAA